MKINVFCRFKERIKKYILSHHRFILSVSGGVDSIALLLMFKMLREEYPSIEIFVVTFNHFFRIESTEEVLFVKQYCDEISVNCKIIDLDSLKGHINGNKSSYAREARYRSLISESRALNCKYILTAHHKDDQIETFLLRLQRGSGIDGLCSIKESRKIDEDIFLLRPLLDIKKQELIDFVISENSKNLPNKDHKWVEDQSNSKPIYKRNVLRHILSKFSFRYSEGHLLENSIISAISHIQSAQKALHHYMMLEFKNIVIVKLGYLVFNKNLFISLPDEIQNRMIVLSLMVIGNHKYKPRFDSFSRCLNIIRGDKNISTTLYGCKIKVSDKYFYILREVEYISNNIIQIYEGLEILWDGRLSIRIEDIRNVFKKNNFFLTKILNEDLSKIKSFNSREKSTFLLTMPVIRFEDNTIVQVLDKNYLDEENLELPIKVHIQFNFFLLIEILLL